MRAVGISAFGAADALRFVEAAVPEPGPGEVLVRTLFAGVNYLDIHFRRGDVAKGISPSSAAPIILGREASGEVAKLGPGVTGIGIGDRVAWCVSGGTYAEYAVVPAFRLVPVPANVPLDIACALQLQGATAHYLTQSVFPLRAGDTALVHSGAGGVGQLLIQIAKATGAIVIATVGSAERQAIAKERGADHVIVRGANGFLQPVIEMTRGQGAHVVYDAVGRDTIADSIKTCRRRGVVVLYGGASGAVDAIDPHALAEAGSLFLTRPHLVDYMRDQAEVRDRSQALLEAWAAGKLSVTIDRVLPLEAAGEAHTLLESRAAKGKILLKTAA